MRQYLTCDINSLVAGRVATCVGNSRLRHRSKAPEAKMSGSAFQRMTGSAFQKKSAANSRGLDGKSTLVAKIYFPFDSSELDAHDRDVLQFLSRHFGHQLPKKRAEFTFYGYADHRGATGYNEQLGKRRAEAVKRCFDGLMNVHPNYTSWSAVTFGERSAVQNKATEDQMAEDRRVEMYCTLVDRPLPYPPDPKPTPVDRVMVMRFLSRQFWKFSAGNSTPTPNLDGTKDAVDGLIRIVNAAIDPESVLGSETSRTTGLVNAAYKVNRITRLITNTLEEGGGGYITNTINDFEYEWGPPERNVLLVEKNETTILHEKLTPHQTMRTLSREEADSNSLTFPPDPDKRPMK
jgi:outer membrane protein OmpA-like peptidoglycan-associated protein